MYQQVQHGQAYGSRSQGNSRGGFGGSRGGRGGFHSSRPSFARKGPPRSTIHPSKYKNAGVVPEVEKEYVTTHSFEDFAFHPKIMENVRRHKYVTPTPIQDQAIPSLMEGRDVVGIANTGTGKTAAFLLPLVHKVVNDPQQGVLILAPTHELAVQIYDEFRMFSAGMPMSASLCIGGASIQRQLDELRQNPHFVIGTPGRLTDLINRGAFHASMFTNVVLDEVDRMLDIGFRKDIRFLISKLSPNRQSAFFSATMNRETEDIMRDFLKNPVTFSVKTRVTSNHIHQDVVQMKPGENKIDVLYNLLKQAEFERVIVFGRTKHGINKLEEILSMKGLRVSSIHGNKTHGARQRALDQFKRGRVQALLATDVAARGIDIDNVSHVINFDEPQTYDDYVHRIGRTGRAGKLGKALTFLS